LIRKEASEEKNRDAYSTVANHNSGGKATTSITSRRKTGIR
jgi:hypothetical protein